MPSRSGSILWLAATASLAVLPACQSPQDKAYEAEAALNEERLDLLKKYEACTKKNEGNEAACEHLLKALEASK